MKSAKNSSLSNLLDSPVDKLKILVKKPETWLGLVVLTTLIFLSWKTVFPEGANWQQTTSTLTLSKPSETSSPEMGQDPATTANATMENGTTIKPTMTATLTATATPSAQATPSPSASPKPISTPTPTEPSETATPSAKVSFKVKVKSGDTFWSIAKRYCKTHNYADIIASENGYLPGKHLRAGDTVTVTCTN